MPIYTKINGAMRKIDAIKTKHNGSMVDIKEIITKINGQMVKIFSKVIGFFAFATFTGAQVGDTIKLNDGMATSDKDYSAYPNDTTITGDFTLTTIAGQVNDTNHTIEIEEPMPTEYDGTILTDVDTNISVIDNTTIQKVTVSTAIDNATIETSANITRSNNDNIIVGGSYYLFNLTIPADKTAIIQSSGIEYSVSDMPLLLKKDTGISLLLKNGDNTYYRNQWLLTNDYDLHYQQINFTYPAGATVTCKVNNVPQSDLTPYCYAGDIISWTCDNAGTITTGTYTVKYSSKDGKIQTITIS